MGSEVYGHLQEFEVCGSGLARSGDLDTGLLALVYATKPKTIIPLSKIIPMHTIV